MSATYAAALADLDAAADGGHMLSRESRQIAAQVGTGRALLEVAEQLEALVELIRPLVEQGETGQVPAALLPDLKLCPRCLDPIVGRTVRITTPGNYVVHEDC